MTGEVSEDELPAPVCATVIVVNYQSSNLLEQNLVPLSEVVDIVVVDNWSDGEERRHVTALGRQHGWCVVTPTTNTGFGGGCNLGAARALDMGADVLVLLNPDASLTAEGVRALVERVRLDPSALVAPRIVTPLGQDWSPGLMVVDMIDGATRSSRRHDASSRVSAPDSTLPWLSGACLAISVNLWRRVGGFDEDYFLYWEDVDLSLRVRTAGGRLAVAEEVVAVHDEGSTHTDRTRGAGKSSTYYYYTTRNRLLFADKHLDEVSRLRWRRASVGAARDIVLRGGRRQLLTSIAPWTAPLRGTLAGLRRRQP